MHHLAVQRFECRNQVLDDESSQNRGGASGLSRIIDGRSIGEGSTIMTVIDTFSQRNTTHAATRFVPLPLRATLNTTIVTCVDPRVDPAHILGLELGEAAVIRN